MKKTFSISFLLALIFVIEIRVSDATLGMDISAPGCSGIDWGCLYNNGYRFAIIQAWAGGYQINPNIGSCVDAAWKAGFAHVDVHAFMCNQCSGNNPPNSGIQTIKDTLSGHKFGMLWFDVEQCSGCWADAGTNCDFVAKCADVASNIGFNVGIYSSIGEWGDTVGGCDKVSSYPLWYAHYDDEENFSDSWAYQFGGWTKPAMKQFTGGATVCGNNIDQDWYPDGYPFLNVSMKGLRVNL